MSKTSNSMDDKIKAATAAFKSKKEAVANARKEWERLVAEAAKDKQALDDLKAEKARQKPLTQEQIDLLRKVREAKDEGLVIEYSANRAKYVRKPDNPEYLIAAHLAKIGYLATDPMLLYMTRDSFILTKHGTKALASIDAQAK